MVKVVLKTGGTMILSDIGGECAKVHNDFNMLRIQDEPNRRVLMIPWDNVVYVEGIEEGE